MNNSTASNEVSHTTRTVQVRHYPTVKEVWEKHFPNANYGHICRDLRRGGSYIDPTTEHRVDRLADGRLKVTLVMKVIINRFKDAEIPAGNLTVSTYCNGCSSLFNQMTYGSWLDLAEMNEMSQVSQEMQVQPQQWWQAKAAPGEGHSRASGNLPDTTPTVTTPRQQEAVVNQVNQIVAGMSQSLVDVGRVQALSFMKKVATVSELKLLKQLKDSKKYKGIPYQDSEGNWKPVSSFEEFCDQVLGVSNRKINEDLLNLNTFGEDFLETAQKLSLGYRDLKKLRNFPEEEREIIINSEALKVGDKDDLIERIEDMAVRHAKEKEEAAQKLKVAETQISELAQKREQQQENLEKLVREKNNKIDQLEIAVAKLSGKSVPYNDQVMEYQNSLSEMINNLINVEFTQLDHLCGQIMAFTKQDAPLRRIMADSLNQLMEALARTREYHGLDGAGVEIEMEDDEQEDWVDKEKEPKFKGTTFIPLPKE